MSCMPHRPLTAWAEKSGVSDVVLLVLELMPSDCQLQVRQVNREPPSVSRL
jgi:hypothetical protein